MRKPFLKWAGNKYKILDYIVPLVGTPQRFVEPFAGTCSVSLNVDAGHYYINDINSDLINLYKEVTNANSDEFIPFCGELFAVTMHLPGAALVNGIQRIVALVSFLIRSSVFAVPSQCA